MLQNINAIINCGQILSTPKEFQKIPPSFNRLMLYSLLFGILFCFFIPILYHWNVEIATGKSHVLCVHEYWEICSEGLKIVGGALFAYLVTIIATNRWQARNISFTMIQELNSKEFLEVRNNLWHKMQVSIATQEDIESIDGWYPYNDYFMSKLNPDNKYTHYKKTLEEMIDSHSLANMVYFAIRFTNYNKSRMINQRLTKHLFHFFFSHYEIVLLEFAEKLVQYRKDLVLKGYMYDERWDLTANDIKEFLEIIGLCNNLPKNHIYIYFPSLNPVQDSPTNEIRL